MLPHDDPRLVRGAPSDVVGRVIDLDGQRIPGASVLLRRPIPDTVAVGGVATDSAGLFQLRAVPAGRYRLSVRRIGYLQQEHAIRLAGGVADTLCLRIRAEPVGLAPVVPTRDTLDLP